MATNEADKLITSEDHDHLANLIPSLCARFWGTGGGYSIRDEISHPGSCTVAPHPPHHFFFFFFLHRLSQPPFVAAMQRSIYLQIWVVL
ncbi:hypothetical protein LMH87_002992 [Akanthomyces muscarius]|uniref:Uncharacterized protein n=1 Tax=Akanthomyces muscarius TaxID=2231603 RepID=A0A9W8Q866_AKAMU|nr:hypothetical protein LMH87_002992 [Akanthomyces muscarius]KAJ4148527.1 hypothetical protein LMH87_002992 [Akanthomyces muscarius]